MGNGSGCRWRQWCPYPTSTPCTPGSSAGFTKQRQGWTPNNPRLGQLGSLGYSKSQRTVNPPIAPARYNFLYSSSRPALRPGDDTTVTGVPASPSHQGKPKQQRACFMGRTGAVNGRNASDNHGELRVSSVQLSSSLWPSTAGHGYQPIRSHGRSRLALGRAGSVSQRSSTATVANVANDSEEPSPRPGQGHHGRRPFGPGDRLPRPGTKASPTRSWATTTSSSATSSNSTSGNSSTNSSGLPTRSPWNPSRPHDQTTRGGACPQTFSTQDAAGGQAGLRAAAYAGRPQHLVITR